MILIWDNGRPCSDHTIFFVDVGDTDIAALEAILAKAVAANPNEPPHIIAMAASLNWRAPGTLMTLAQFAQAALDYSAGGHHTDCDGWPCTCWVAELCRLAGVRL